MDLFSEPIVSLAVLLESNATSMMCNLHAEFVITSMQNCAHALRNASSFAREHTETDMSACEKVLNPNRRLWWETNISSPCKTWNVRTLRQRGKNHTSPLICIDGLEETSMLCSSVRGKMFKWRLIQISACSVLVKLKQFIFLLLTIPPFSDCGNVI